MENKESQILSEIMDMMASIRSQLEMLDAKMAELQNTVGQGEAEAMPIDLDIDDLPETEEVAPVVEETVVVEDDLPFYDDLTDGPAVEEPVAEEPVVEDDDDDMPIFADPEPVQEAVPAPQKPKTAVIDAMTDRQAWRTDMPGTAVKDIRSAISLNDRILFINNLFGQDPMKFQDALTKINQMASLEEVVEYVETEQPGWNLESDTVYRFMMAVRRKVR
jgi:hypothetical protein